MKAKIIYYTKTGHSRKIANRVGEELKIEVLDVKENPELEEVDLLFVVGGIYGGQSDKALLEYIDGLPEGAVKKAALMTSCTSMKSPQDQVRERLEVKGIDVLKDEFICRGNFPHLRMGSSQQGGFTKGSGLCRKYFRKSRIICPVAL